MVWDPIFLAVISARGRAATPSGEVLASRLPVGAMFNVTPTTGCRWLLANTMFNAREYIARNRHDIVMGSSGSGGGPGLPGDRTSECWLS